MTRDPREIVQTGDMTAFQIIVVTLCVVIMALDGFDTLVIAYTAPSIAQDWHIGPASLGIVFGASLLGMGLGGLLISPLADKVGRRPIMMLSLVILATGMFVSAYARDVTELALLRIFTGIGIGSALASVNIIAAEYSSDRRRALAVSLVTLGYPLGATLGGAASIYLIGAYGWRSVYVFGALVAVALIPLSLIWLPESIDFLATRRPNSALERINAILRRMGRPALQSLPALSAHHAKTTRATDLFRPPHLAGTLASGTAYLCSMFTVYFLLSWIPKLLTELGFSIASGISSSLLMNIAGMIGILSYGLLAEWVGAKKLAAFVAIALFVVTVNFGYTPAEPTRLLIATIGLGLFLFTTINTLYVVTVSAFEPQLRSTGVGFIQSVGRIGAFLGPFVAGLLIANGWSREAYCIVLALPALLIPVALFWINSARVMHAPQMAES